MGYCMMFATGILFLDGLVHLLVPAPRHRTKGGGWDSDEDDEFLKDSSSESEDEELGACQPLLSCAAEEKEEKEEKEKEKEGPCKACCNRNASSSTLPPQLDLYCRSAKASLI